MSYPPSSTGYTPGPPQDQHAMLPVAPLAEPMAHYHVPVAPPTQANPATSPFASTVPSDGVKGHINHTGPFHLLRAAATHLATSINDKIRAFLERSASEHAIDHFSATFRLPPNWLPPYGHDAGWAEGLVFAPKVLENGADMLGFCTAESEFVWFLWAGEPFPAGSTSLEKFLQEMVMSGELVHRGSWCKAPEPPRAHDGGSGGDGGGREREWVGSPWNRFLTICHRARREARDAAVNMDREAARESWVRVVPYRFLKGREGEEGGEGLEE